MHDFFGLFETKRNVHIEHEDPVSTMNELLDTWSLTINARFGEPSLAARDVLRSSVIRFPNRKNKVFYTYEPYLRSWYDTNSNLGRLNPSNEMHSYCVDQNERNAYPVLNFPTFVLSVYLHQ